MTDHIYWQDVIEIDSSGHSVESKSPEDIARYEERLERFLDYLENTEQGQEMLHTIQEKHCRGDWGGEKLSISLTDTGPSMSASTENRGRIQLNIDDSAYLVFVDKESGEITPFCFERSALHELCHAADDRLPLGVRYNPLSPEEYATQQADEFARNNMPELGQRGKYINFFGQPPYDMLDCISVDGREYLEQNPMQLERIREELKAEVQKLGPEREYELLKQEGSSPPAPATGALGFS